MCQVGAVFRLVRCGVQAREVTLSEVSCRRFRLQYIKSEGDRMHDMLKQVEGLAAVRVGVPRAG
jgi:hypothetical protein